MPHVVTAIDIAASKEKVWDVLTNIAAYPQWNPLIPWMKGELTPGQRVRFRFCFNDRTFPVTVRILQADGTQLRWVGPSANALHIVARAEHFFELAIIKESKADKASKTRLYHGERFSGMVMQMLSGRIEREVRPVYENFNEAIKARAEQS